MNKLFLTSKKIIIAIVVIVAVNILSSFFYTRIDLTSEKKYTLSPLTKELLANLDDYLYVKVMFTGKDLPMSFKRLKNETKEMLDEFAAYSRYVDYDFIDPVDYATNRDDLMAVYNELLEKGLQATDLRVNNKMGSERKIIFPAALISYQGKEMPLQLLQSQMGIPSEEVLNNSVQNLEYNISNAIRKLQGTHKSPVAIIDGYGCLDRDYYQSFEDLLKEYYNVSSVTIDGQLNSLADIKAGTDTNSVTMTNKYKAIIIPGPTKPISEKDKFIIDQYIMRGGKVLWLVEPVKVSMDSLQNSPTTMVTLNYTNLQDQLFNYGVRIEPQLIMDIQCLSIPLTTGSVGGRPQIEYFPWYFFPVITPLGNNPIIKNLNAVKTEFISPITAIDVPNVKSTVLLHSSSYTKIFATPDIISLEFLTHHPEKELFNKKNIPVVMLLEGKFHSAYDNRVPAELIENKLINFKSESDNTAMIVVSDVDMIRNQFKIDGSALNMGYDKYTDTQFANPELFLNIMNYLCDDSKLISVRSRELKLRILDVTKVHNNSLKYQLINIILPSLIIILGGIVYILIRKRKYSK